MFNVQCSESNHLLYLCPLSNAVARSSLFCKKNRKVWEFLGSGIYNLCFDLNLVSVKLCFIIR